VGAIGWPTRTTLRLTVRWLLRVGRQSGLVPFGPFLVITSVLSREDQVGRGSWRPLRRAHTPTGAHGSYLVDSASSHMLVSKIKPCMSKYKQLYGETANGSLNQLSFI
jgi:hypothetical protein